MTLRYLLPKDIRDQRMFLLFKLIKRRGGKHAKFDKIPFYADGTKRRGKQGSAEDRENFVTYAEARAAQEASNGAFAGIGIALLPEFEITGIDFDGCIDEQGQCAQWVLDLCQGTYAERSPSGRGVHALFRGAVPDFKNLAEGVEVFHENGFLTHTGDALLSEAKRSAEVAPLPDSVRRVIEGFRPSNAQGIYEEGGDRDAPYYCTDIGEPTLTHLKQALDFLSSDDRDQWSLFAHALKPLGDLGKGLWEEWSKKSPKYVPRDAARVWRSVRSSRIGYRVVFAVAYRAGWSGPLAPQPTSYWPPCIDLRALSNRTPQSPKFIIDDWLPCGYATLLAGHGGIGKSGTALHLMVCIAMGHHFFGLPTAQRRVLYVSCEDRESILHWRLKHICTYEGISIADLVGRLEIVDLVGHDSVLYARDPRTVETRTAAYEQVQERMRALGTEILVVDGISDAFGGNENSKVEAKQFVNSLIALIPAESGAVLLIGHVAKPAASAPNTSEGYSGTTGWHNAARARWYLYPETEPGDDWNGGRLARNGYLQLELQKSNYGASDQAIRLRWDQQAQLFVGQRTLTNTNPAHRVTQEAAEKQAILAAGRAAISKGINVPAATTGPNTGFHVLSAEPLFPSSLKGPANRKRFARLIREMQSAQQVRTEAYKSSSRHEQKRLVFP